jgi:hypothetical protein
MYLSSNPFEPVYPRPLPEQAPVVHHEACDRRECPDCHDCIDPDWNLSRCRRCTVRRTQEAGW